MSTPWQLSERETLGLLWFEFCMFFETQALHRQFVFEMMGRIHGGEMHRAGRRYKDTIFRDEFASRYNAKKNHQHWQAIDPDQGIARSAATLVDLDAARQRILVALAQNGTHNVHTGAIDRPILLRLPPAPYEVVDKGKPRNATYRVQAGATVPAPHGGLLPVTFSNVVSNPVPIPAGNDNVTAEMNAGAIHTPIAPVNNAHQAINPTAATTTAGQPNQQTMSGHATISFKQSAAPLQPFAQPRKYSQVKRKGADMGKAEDGVERKRVRYDDPSRPPWLPMVHQVHLRQRRGRDYPSLVSGIERGVSYLSDVYKYGGQVVKLANSGEVVMVCTAAACSFCRTGHREGQIEAGFSTVDSPTSGLPFVHGTQDLKLNEHDGTLVIAPEPHQLLKGRKGPVHSVRMFELPPKASMRRTEVQAEIDGEARTINAMMCDSKHCERCLGVWRRLQEEQAIQEQEDEVGTGHANGEDDVRGEEDDEGERKNFHGGAMGYGSATNGDEGVDDNADMNDDEAMDDEELF